ncbi:complex I assembly factor TIMMDC1, mitochondrial [Arapaima gigas]
MAPDLPPTDSAPWPRAHSRLSSWCLLLLPGVHAVATPTLESQQASTTLPQHLGKPEFPDSGWERIKDLFHREEMQPYSEEVTNMVKSAMAASLLGMVYGGVPAARHARERFIQQSHAEVFQNRFDAVRSSHNAAIRGFVRYGWRWGWRVSAFVTLFNTVSTGISIYRDKYTVNHYVAAGAVTGGMFRLNLGLGGVVAGSAIGAVLGLPAGVAIIAMQKLAGETVRERRRRERRELYELKLEEWCVNARLQLSEELINQMNSSNQDLDSDSDLQKIQELLGLPRNEGVVKDSGAQ